MANQTKFTRRFSALLAGAMIGTFIGYIADQSLTRYVLQHSQDMARIIMTNALSAFIVFPLFIILGAVIGYRLQKNPRGKNTPPRTPKH